MLSSWRPKPRNLKGRAVDEELGAADLDRPDADREAVRVDDRVAVVNLDGEGVEVAVARLPQACILDPQRPPRPGPLGEHRAAGVAQPHRQLAAARKIDRVVDEPGGPVEPGHHRDVGDMVDGHRVEPHRAGEPGVVEEVMTVGLAPATVCVDGDVAGRDGLGGELVVDRDGHPDLVAGDRLVGDVGLEGRVAPDVLGDESLTDVHPALVGGGIDPDTDPLAGPAPRHPHRSLVPDPPDVLADGTVGEQVVVARWHRSLERRVEGAPERLGARIGVESEPPQAVESKQLPGRGRPGSEHGLSARAHRGLARSHNMRLAS